MENSKYVYMNVKEIESIMNSSSIINGSSVPEYHLPYISIPSLYSKFYTYLIDHLYRMSPEWFPFGCFVDLSLMGQVEYALTIIEETYHYDGMWCEYKDFYNKDCVMFGDYNERRYGLVDTDDISKCAIITLSYDNLYTMPFDGVTIRLHTNHKKIICNELIPNILTTGEKFILKFMEKNDITMKDLKNV
jgi:hypothetical protein